MQTTKLHPLFYQLNKRQKITVEVLVFISSIAVAIGQTIVFTVLQPLGRELGLEPIHVGFIIVGSSVIFAAGSNIWGRQSERWGRKAIILLGLTGYSLGTILFTSIFYLGFQGLLAGTALIIGLTLARMFQSTLMSAAPPAATAYVADITDAETRTAAMARIGASHGLGTILGPAIAGALAGFALLAPLYFAAILPFVCAIACWFGLPKVDKNTFHVGKTIKVSYFDKRIRRFIFIGIFMYIAFAAMNMTLGFYIQDLMRLDAANTIKTLGKLAMFSALASVFSQWFFANYLKWSALWLIRLGVPLMTLGVINIIFSTEFASFAISYTLIGLGMGIVGPGFSSATSLELGHQEQGAAAGLISSCAPIGFIFGPLIGPALYQVSPILPYWFTSIVMVILSFYCLVLLKIRKTN